MAKGINLCVFPHSETSLFRHPRNMAERVGFEPTVQLPAHMISSHAVSASSRTSPLANIRSIWWSRRGSNPWPHPCEGCALPSELLPHSISRKEPSDEIPIIRWRRERDSNPRCSFPHSGFRDRPDRPTLASLHIAVHLSAFSTMVNWCRCTPTFKESSKHRG